MIAKELLYVRWKFLSVTALVCALAFVGLGALDALIYDFPLAKAPIDGLDAAVYGIHETYAQGGVPLSLLAFVLGAGIVSGEIGENTIFTLLSKPVSRVRVLLTKYAVCAGTLLVAAVLGHALNFALLSLDYTREAFGAIVGALDVFGIVLSTLLLWLGSLFVLGLAMLFSIVIGNVVLNFLLTALALYQIAAIPLYLETVLSFTGRSLSFARYTALYENFTLFNYWADSAVFVGESLALTNFVVCFFAAIIPLGASLWLFERKKF